MAKVFRNAEAERRIQEYTWVRIARRHEVRLRREIAAQYMAAARAVGAGRKPPKPKGARLAVNLEAVMRDAYQTIGQRTARAIKESQGKAGKRAVAMSPEFEAELEKYIRKYTGRKVKEIDDATKDRIAKIVKRGIDEGLTNAEVSALISEAAKIDSAYRAARIARTESHSAANAGSLASAKESGVVQEKEWIFTEDERTRDGSEGEFDHTNVANVPIDKPFVVSGEPLMYPGDPSGSAGNIINCRCAVGYVV